jgi:hypothetical protein
MVVVVIMMMVMMVRSVLKDDFYDLVIAYFLTVTFEV